MLVWITVVDFLCARAIFANTGGRRTLFLTISIVSDLGLLGFFKYAGFFEQSLLTLLGGIGFAPDWPVLSILLPIGISFVVFESMSYTIDVYRGDLEPLD